MLQVASSDQSFTCWRDIVGLVTLKGARDLLRGKACYKTANSG